MTSERCWGLVLGNLGVFDGVPAVENFFAKQTLLFRLASALGLLGYTTQVPATSRVDATPK